jgi:nucleoside-diphosphate-sugar epimerase
MARSAAAMRIFLTGATGFIGAHLCRHLVAAGHQVVALVRDPDKARRELPASGVETFTGDLSIFDRDDLVLPACDIVIHLAGVVAAPTPEDYDAINFVAVTRLVRTLARQSWRPRRFLFASSLAAAGPSPDRVPLTERDPARPTEPYGRAKWKAEQFLAAEAPFPTTSFRPSLVFGPRDTATLAFFRMARRGVGVRVAGAPQQLSYIDVDDAVAGIAAMMDDTSDQHRTYFLAAREPMDTEVLWRAMSEAIGRRVRVIAVPRPVLRAASFAMTGLSRALGFTNQLDAKQVEQMMAPAFLCSSAALEAAHAWTPRISFTASLAKAWAGYRADGWL